MVSDQHANMERKMIYLATSWKNEAQPAWVESLRAASFEVYDFRAHEGFRWIDVDQHPDASSIGPTQTDYRRREFNQLHIRMPRSMRVGIRAKLARQLALGGSRRWSGAELIAGLAHPLAVAGFEADRAAMERASACVLLLPCGRPAHIEAGFIAGQGKPLIVVLEEGERNVPELMYKLATAVVTNIDDCIDAIREAYCDGDHPMPECASPECWHRDPGADYLECATIEIPPKK